MPAILYSSTMEDAVSPFFSGSFRVLLVGEDYSPQKSNSRRSDVTDEIDGIGYPKGGPEVAVTVLPDPSNDRTIITFGGVTLPDATLKARYAVYYKARGGAPSADELVAVLDFGSYVISTTGDFELGAVSIELRGQS